MSKSYKGEMGNGVRENPKISQESSQNSATFGVEFEFRSAPYGSVELPECCKKDDFYSMNCFGKIFINRREM